MKEDIIFNENEKELSFYKKSWQRVARVDNIPKIVELVKSSNWVDKNGYLYSDKYKNYLHRLVMETFVGKSILDDYTKMDYVVDHINNSEPYNCCIDNLHLLPARKNKAKAFTVDYDVEKVRLKAGIGFYVLKQNEYQMAIGFNTPTAMFIDGKWVMISTIHINFDNFDKCFLAAQIVLTALKNNSDINIKYLQATKWEYTEVATLELTEEEKKQKGCVYIRDNKFYIAINNDISKGPLCLIYKPAKKE